MDKKMIWGVVKGIFKIAVTLAIVILIYNLGLKAYDFGYRIFAEEPVELGTGRTVSVSIVEGKTNVSLELPRYGFASILVEVE